MRPKFIRGRNPRAMRETGKGVKRPLERYSGNADLGLPHRESHTRTRASEGTRAKTLLAECLLERYPMLCGVEGSYLE